jgi:hypothetical protein
VRGSGCPANRFRGVGGSSCRGPITGYFAGLAGNLRIQGPCDQSVVFLPFVAGGEGAVCAGAVVVGGEAYCLCRF